MPTSTAIQYAEQGSQYAWDILHGWFFNAGGGIAILVIMIMMGVITLGILWIRRLFPRKHL